MQHAKTILFAISAIAILGGCTPSYRETLEQKTEGKPAQEKRAILAQECGEEINKGMKKDDPANLRHFEKMQQICEEMTGQKIKVDKK